MKIINNFLKENDFNLLVNIIGKLKFNYNPFIFNSKKYSNYAFNTFSRHLEFPNKNTKLNDIINKIINNLKIKNIIRIKVNITVGNFVDNSIFHIDNNDINAKSAILYINSNNGYTEFQTGEKIYSEKNKLIIFNSNIYHKAIQCSDKKYRIVLNIVYY